jgi:uncharacterized protein (TIGR02996 family)
MNPTESALLAAVLASPADDLPRLVFCDFLDERDGPGDRKRAEFIRVQVEWMKRGGKDHDNKAFDSREKELLRRFGDTWAGVKASGLRLQWYRGFISEVRCTLADWCGVECECVSRWELHRVPPGEVIDGHGCYACNGTGTTPGIGPAVVRSHPVDRVVLTDREPWRNQDGSYSWWMMYEGTTEETPDVPEKVWNHLLRPDGASRYPTREATVTALSAALIAWAKSQPHPARISATPVSVDITSD